MKQMKSVWKIWINFGKRKETCVKSVKYLQNKHTNKQNIIIKNLTFINYTTKKTN